MKRRVAVVITARPSYSRVKTALAAIDRHPELDLKLIVAASALLPRYGDVSSVIEQDGFSAESRVYMVLEGESPVAMAKTTGLGIIELATTFDAVAPDVVVTIADRYETLATAVAASYMNIPLAHIQGGEVTGSIDEKVRHAVTKLSDLHFVATEAAAHRLARMGEKTDSVIRTGCPSIDLAAAVACEEPVDTEFVFTKYGGTGPVLDLSRGYIVVLQHPVTTEYKSAFDQICETLAAIGTLDIPVLWFWPNVDAGSDAVSKGIRAFREHERPQHVHFFRNMDPTDFLTLLVGCACLIGNSSVGIRECSYLGVPVVNIGSRQGGREHAENVRHVDHDREMIRAAILRQVEHGRFQKSELYGDGRAGVRIAEGLASRSLSCEKRLAY